MDGSGAVFGSVGPSARGVGRVQAAPDAVKAAHDACSYLHTTSQHNLAVMVALENETEATRFLDPGDLRPSMRGGVELERLARGKKWTDLPVGRLLRAGECVLFSTRWWHAGPGQAQGAGFRRVIFLPLTGGTKDRKGKSEHVRLPRQNI